MRAIVFDMDGVLADTEPVHFAAAKEVLGAAGHTYTWEQNHEFFGRTTRDMFLTLDKRLGLGTSVEALMGGYHQAVLRRLEAGPLVAAPGVTGLLDALHGRNLAVALASSSHREWVNATLGALGLKERFHVIVSGDQVRIGKPDPEIYLLTAARLGIAPERCIAIEDSPAGLLAAKRASMYAIGVRTPYFDPSALPADEQIASLDDFPFSLIDDTDAMD